MARRREDSNPAELNESLSREVPPDYVKRADYSVGGGGVK